MERNKRKGTNEKRKSGREKFVCLFVGWLLNVPATD